MADPQVVAMKESLDKLQGEVLTVLEHVCPKERVTAHETRLNGLDTRMTTMDTRLTTIGAAVTSVREAVEQYRDLLQSSSATERSERGLWLDQLNRLLTTQSLGITQSITMLGDRVGEQGKRIDALGTKIELVMATNETLLEHQTNGLANAIANAVSTAVTTAVTGEATAHKITVDADADLVVAEAEADAKRNPWLLRLLQTPVVHIPLGGWLAIATVILAIAALDIGIARAVLEWLRESIK